MELEEASNAFKNHMTWYIINPKKNLKFLIISKEKKNELNHLNSHEKTCFTISNGERSQ